MVEGVIHAIQDCGAIEILCEVVVVDGVVLAEG